MRICHPVEHTRKRPHRILAHPARCRGWRSAPYPCHTARQFASTYTRGGARRRGGRTCPGTWRQRAAKRRAPGAAPVCQYIHAGRRYTQQMCGDKRCSRSSSSPPPALYLPRGATCITDDRVPGATLVFHLPLSLVCVRAHGSRPRIPPQSEVQRT